MEQNPALMATKTSILVFYLRLSKNTQKVLRLGSWLTLAVVNIAGTVLTIMNIFQCRPVNSSWEGYDTSKCIPLLTEFICAAPINIVTDLAILALPIPVLTGMRLPSRQKTILVFTFGLGIFVTIVDVVRIYYLQQAITEVPTGVSNNPDAKFGSQTEFAWNASLSFMWSAVEVNVGITCACIPTLKPLILRILPAMLFDPDGSRGGSNSQTQDEKDLLPARSSQGALPLSPSQPTTANVQLPPPAHASNAGDSEFSALEFLTTPDMNLSDLHPQPARGLKARSETGGTGTTAATYATNGKSPGQAIYFGFVNMAKPKSMLKCSAAESFKYSTAVTILFLLWGMSYGLLNTLNNAIAAVAGMTTAQTLGLTSAYFGGGYFFGPLLVGEWILRRDEHRRIGKARNANLNDNIGGFKVTFIVGLCIYGIGTIIFWPSAVTNSWGGFMLSSFVVGFGLSVLETGANAFLILCGPAEFGEARLLLAQAIQAVGSVLSGLLAQKVFFKGISSVHDLDSMVLLNVQWTYLAITLVCVILALFFYYMPLPEVSDNELDQAAKRLPVSPEKRSIGGLQLRTWLLVLAVVAQYTYVAAQESNSIFVPSLLMSGFSNGNPPPAMALEISDYIIIAHTAFAVSRFLCGYLAYLSVHNPSIPKPRILLTISVSLSVLFATLAVVLRPSNPNLVVVPVVLFYFSEGPCWPLIFAIGLRGQGKRTKRAAAFITMGGSGPAFFPFVMYAIGQNGGTIQHAFIVVLALQVVTGVYPLFLETMKDARQMTDPKTSIACRNNEGEEEDININEVIADLNRQRRTSNVAAMRRATGKKKGVGAKLGHRMTASSTAPIVEHAENSDGAERSA
jgi:fucose permease